jgi:UDP-GlcNAc:undecaprenyl-phosphate GlcNAc-1-phosphate transferase
MQFPVPILLAFLISLASAMVLVPLLSALARRVDLVDKPDNLRKLHATAIPLVGGIATFLAVVFGTYVVFVAFDFRIPFRGADSRELLGLLISSLFLLLVGVVDDRFGLRGRQKLVGQIIAVSILIYFGYHFESISILNQKLDFGVLSYAIVCLWCLAAINSVNLLDGADGFASTIGIILCMTLGIMSVYRGQWVDGILCFSVAGALLGFLKYNFPPARVYLGDAGSMLIGLFLAAISIRCAFKQVVAYSAFAPVALLAIPLIDTTAAIIRRRMTGRSIYTEDRGHLHHVLAKRGLSPVGSLMWVGALCSMTATGAILALVMRQAEYALASVVLVIVVMVAGKIFGVAEFKLLTRRLVGLILSFVKPVANRNASGIDESVIQLQGSFDWNETWAALTSFADAHKLNQILFDINAPWMHEGFHGVWKRKSANSSGNHQWLVELPMIVEGRILGRIKVFAPRDNHIDHHLLVVELLDIVRRIEEMLTEQSMSAAEHKLPPSKRDLSESVENETGEALGAAPLPR